MRLRLSLLLLLPLALSCGRGTMRLSSSPYPPQDSPASREARSPGRTSLKADRQLSKELEELDRIIAERPIRERSKWDRMNSLKSSYRVARTYEDRMALARSLVDEYVPYNFDSTLVWLAECRRIAEQAHRRDGIAWADIRKGEILAGAGYYMESYRTLSEIVDPAALPEDIRTLYYFALYRLSDNVTENSLGGSETLLLQSRQAYIDSLLVLYRPGSPEWESMQVIRLLHAGMFREARENNAVLRETLGPDSHDYAKACYWESVLCDSLGLAREKLLWEIASAKADFQNAVRDYASLNMVANDLMDIDITHSFRYIQTALYDAVFYNAKLRPWQISRHLVPIQATYEARFIKAHRRIQAYSWILSLFVLLLVLGLMLVNRINVRLLRSKSKVDELNRQLQLANTDISRSNAELQESNSIKERYIGLFLSQLSDNIDKVKSLQSQVIKQLSYGNAGALLKEMRASTAVEQETDAFYDTFDTTFLAMFPDFVAQFNDLLEAPARIVLKKGEKLNTELRIFALMRLGIEDSNAIAGLLKYSVRTIYNYKVKIRNAARVPREEFDEMIRKIG